MEQRSRYYGYFWTKLEIIISQKLHLLFLHCLKLHLRTRKLANFSFPLGFVTLRRDNGQIMLGYHVGGSNAHITGITLLMMIQLDDLIRNSQNFQSKMPSRF